MGMEIGDSFVLNSTITTFPSGGKSRCSPKFLVINIIIKWFKALATEIEIRVDFKSFMLAVIRQCTSIKDPSSFTSVVIPFHHAKFFKKTSN